MEVIRLDSVQAADWDAHIKGTSEANLGQSHYWARVMRRAYGAEPIFLAVEGMAHLLLYQVANVDRRNLAGGPIWRALGNRLSTTLEWFDGPVFHQPALAADAAGALLSWIDDYLTRTPRVTQVRCNGLAHTGQHAGSEAIVQVFEQHGYEPDKWATLLVDLTADEETLWMDLHKAGRKSVRKARREELVVRRITGLDDYLQNFYAPYAATHAATGSSINPPRVARVVFEEDADTGYYEYFVAESAEGRVLGLLGMYMFNGVATEISSALTPYAYEEKLPAQDILHWEMILYAKAHGCHTFDLAGIDPDPTDSKARGIRRFKEKWGGRFVEFYRFNKRTGPGRWRRAAGAGLARLARRLT